MCLAGGGLLTARPEGMNDAFFGNDLELMVRKRLLILRGPSGAGKTATISALAKLMELELSEWKNPVDSDFSSEAYTSMSAKFEDFLGRSGRYGSLDFKGDTAPIHPSHNQPKALVDDKQKKAVLMEEFSQYIHKHITRAEVF